MNHSIVLIGFAGSGQTRSSLGLLKKLDPEVFCFYNVNMSYHAGSKRVRAIIEIPLEKKAGGLYAPPGISGWSISSSTT